VRPGRSRRRAQVGGGGALPWEGRLRSEQCRAGLGPGGKGFCAKKSRLREGRWEGKTQKDQKSSDLKRLAQIINVHMSAIRL
jgi:hypothetical protein